MNDVVDMCRAIKDNSLHFTLNPQNCWQSFNTDFCDIVNSDEWKEIKFMNDSATEINESIDFSFFLSGITTGFPSFLDKSYHI